MSRSKPTQLELDLFDIKLDLNKHSMKPSLKYDDNNPQHRREVEQWLTRPKVNHRGAHLPVDNAKEDRPPTRADRIKADQHMKKVALQPNYDGKLFQQLVKDDEAEYKKSQLTSQGIAQILEDYE